METVRLNYVPATNRRTMARLGQVLEMEIDGKSFSLSPDEMHGEVEWRIAVMRWLVRKTFLYLVSLPKQRWIPDLLEVEKSLMVDTGLHRLEAQAVAESALKTASDLTDSDIHALGNGAPYFKALINHEWEVLRKRYREMVRSQPFDAAKWAEQESDLSSVSEDWLSRLDERVPTDDDA